MAVYFGISLVALVASLALAIDIGRLYNAQRSLQRAANVAALDAARVTNGCLGYVADASAQSVAQTEVAASLVRNNMPAGYLPGNGVQLGRLSRTNDVRYFEPLGSSDASSRTAVQVRLQRPPPGRLLPLTAGPIMTATAAADSRPVVTFSVGSGLASVNGGLANSLLGGLIGGSLSLNALSYQGLANTNVRLGDLAIAAHALTLDDYLGTQTSLPSAIDAIANGLGSGQSATVRTTLHQIASAASAGRNVTPGNVILAPLGLDGENENALVNVGQLVMALAQSANGTNAVNITIPGGVVNIPGVASVVAKIVLVEAPKIAVVRAGDQDTYASTAQGQIDLDVKLGIVNLAQVHLPLAIRLAKATASLDEVQCARRGQPQHKVAIDATTSVATVGIGKFTNPISAPVPVVAPDTIIDVAGLVTLKLGLLVNAGGAQDKPIDFDGPFPSQVQTVGTDTSNAVDSALSGVGQANLQVSGLVGGLAGALLQPLVNTVTSTVVGLITPVLNVVTDSLIEPLLGALGVSLGTADVQVVSLVPSNNPGADTDEPLSLQAFLFTH